MNTTTRNNSWMLSIAVAFLAASGVGAGIFHFFNEPYNPAFLENPQRG